MRFYFTTGLIIGILMAALYVGFQWKNAVTSGAYFSVGKVFYTCEKAYLEVK